MNNYFGRFGQRLRRVGLVIAVGIFGIFALGATATAADTGLPDGVHTITGTSGMHYAGWLKDLNTSEVQDAMNFNDEPGSTLALIPDKNVDHEFELHAYAYNASNDPISLMAVLQSITDENGAYSFLTMSRPSRIESNNTAIISQIQYSIADSPAYQPYTGQGVGESDYKIGVGVNTARVVEPGQYVALVLPFKLQSTVVQTSLYTARDVTTPFYSTTFTRFANGDYDSPDYDPFLRIQVTYDHGYPVIIKHVDADGNPIGTDKTIDAKDNETQDAKSIDLTKETVAGYKQDASNPAEYDYSVGDGHDAVTSNTPHVITLRYTKTATTNGGSGSGGGGTTTPTTPITTPEQPHTIPTTTGQTGLGVTTTVGGQEVAAKGQAVYALRGIYLYKNKTFTASARRAHYPKARRINRPMFVVTGYTYSKNGALRYIVRDVNHTKKTDGWKGYITASSKYVVPVYYAALPKSRTITVIAKNGINAYNKVNLTSKAKHYKKGAHLKVKKIVRHNLTTRYVLSNGDYITANKKLIIAGKY